MISITHGRQGEGMSYDAQSLPASTSPRELRLLCMLDTGRNGKARTLPVHTLQRLQTPWAAVSLQWSLVLPDGLQMRETHAQQPTSEVLERYSRLGQAGALRPAVGCHQ